MTGSQFDEMRARFLVALRQLRREGCTCPGACRVGTPGLCRFCSLVDLHRRWIYNEANKRKLAAASAAKRKAKR
jgi:hypothetical protein